MPMPWCGVRSFERCCCCPGTYKYPTNKRSHYCEQFNRASRKQGSMLNSNSLNAVNGAKYSRRFVKPLYDTYCFSALPQTVEFLLTGEGERVLPRDCFGNLPTRYDRVILFFVDAFG